MSSERLRLKRELYTLAKGTAEVIGERPNDDLPCHFCDSIGGVLIVEFGDKLTMSVESVRCAFASRRPNVSQVTGVSNLD